MRWSGQGARMLGMKERRCKLRSESLEKEELMVWELW